ncbi:hypothetical protein HK097_008888 [Rhizophlyctis rosea]|uniref:Integrase catalytic domain-containing protein n=1 Tax=Rhizophlyctis rosea TaxID=64517 RepID=A0AAD5SL13_9FUNG|nr:hypothetical protein HK097_008888 [Rhizophlyctis rosea]
MPFNAYSAALVAVDIFSKKGPSFKGDFVEWLKTKGIHHNYSRAHTPQSNGVVEAKNGVYKSILYRLMKTRDTDDWVSLTSQVVESMNSTFSYATKKSANEIEENQELHIDVGAMIERAANRRYKRKALIADLKLGDYVRRRKDLEGQLTKGAKVGYYSEEIYQIERIVKGKFANMSSSYTLRDVDKDTVKPSLYRRRDLLGIPDPREMDKIPEQIVRPGPVNEDAVNEEPEWEVENIVGKRIGKPTRNRSGVSYRVRYKGWKKLYWEPVENLTNSQELIDEFEESQR